MSRQTRRTALMLAPVLTSLLAAGALAGPAGAASRAPATASKVVDDPLVFGHRGASGYRPEHTLAGYTLAARMGADYIEPDLVSTKDGVLVDRHENDISGTTDVAAHPEFAARRTTQTVDGTQITGWFTEDFTLAELRTLRAKERLPDLRQHNTLYDGRYRVPTFQQVITHTKKLSRQLHREIGIIPELKHSTYFRAAGLALEGRFIRVLRANGLDRRNAKVYVQSFETANLKRLNQSLKVPLVQLTDVPTAQPADIKAAGGTTTYADLLTPAGLREIAKYADAIGPGKDSIVPRDPTGKLLAPTSLVDDAHAAGLKVTPYTFRNEDSCLPLDFRRGDPAAPGYLGNYGDAFAEYALFFGLGVDAVFSDNPDTAVEARDAAVAAAG